jgi:DNA-binding CsgD family transcriptional regulator
MTLSADASFEGGEEYKGGSQDLSIRLNHLIARLGIATSETLNERRIRSFESRVHEASIYNKLADNLIELSGVLTSLPSRNPDANVIALPGVTLPGTEHEGQSTDEHVESVAVERARSAGKQDPRTLQPGLPEHRPNKKRELSLEAAGMSVEENRLVSLIAMGGTPRTIAKDESWLPKIEDQLKQIMLKFGARTPAHLLRKIIHQNYGQLPYREFPDVDLKKEQLSVLQYLSVGGRAAHIAYRIEGTNNKSDMPAAIRLINELKEIFDAKTEAEIVYKGFLTGWLGCESEEFIQQKEEQIRNIVKMQRLQGVSLQERVPDSVHLTPKELSVLELFDEGLSVKQIADRLNFSKATASHHVSNILKKFNASSRDEVINSIQQAT